MDGLVRSTLPMNVDQVYGVHWLVQAAVMEGAFANGSAFGGTPAEEIYRR